MDQMIITLEKIVEAYAKMVEVSYIQVFFFFVLMDILTGFAKGFKNKRANSTKGLLGIVKHLLVVVLVLSVYPYLTLLGANAVAFAFVMSFIASYAISVIENWGQLGLPMPAFAKVYFEKLKHQNDSVSLPFDVHKMDKE